MSLVRCSSLKSILNTQLYRSSYSCLIHLQSPRRKEDTKTPRTQSYHSFITHQNSLTNTSSSSSSSFPRNNHPLPSFKSLALSSSSSNRFVSTFNFSTPIDTVRVVTDCVLQYGISNTYALHNVTDALALLEKLIGLVNAFTFSQWWVCLIVTSLLIRGVSIPDMIAQLNTIVQFFKGLGSTAVSAQGNALKKVNGSLLSKSGRVMYTMLEKEFVGVKGSILGKGIQVLVFWLSAEELKRNMVEILMSSLRGKMLAAELMRKGILNKGRLVVVVGDGFGLEIQMFDLDFALIMRRRRRLV